MNMKSTQNLIVLVWDFHSPKPQHLVRWKKLYYYRLSTACLVKSAPQTDTERGEPRPTEDFSPNGDLGGGAKSIFDIKLDAGSVFCL